MPKVLRTALVLSLALGLAPRPAAANLDDDKPWNWDDQELMSGAKGNEASESLQHELRERHQQPNLKLVIDHPSWDAYLAKQLKQPVLSKRASETPGSTCNMAFRIIRDFGDAGIWPGYGRNPPDTEPVEEEFRAKIDQVICKYDVNAESYRLDYDPKAKALVFIAGRKNPSAVDYIQTDLIALSKKHFPKLKAWYIRHGKIEEE